MSTRPVAEQQSIEDLPIHAGALATGVRCYRTLAPAIGLIVSLMVTSTAVAQAATRLSSVAQARLKIVTPAEDELLHRLEKDFVDLLKKSPHADALLEAEKLLEATNDNTHWTNYSQATQLLRRTPDKAAIPLLLRYIVLHSQRSACHIMIPEYAKTISALSGHQLDNPYVAGPDLEKRMRVKVAQIVTDWWSKEIDRIVTQPEKLTDAQLRVVVSNLLKEVQQQGDYSGTGGRLDSAYGAYHNVYYRVVSESSSDRFEFPKLHAAMIPLLLEPSGYRSSDNAASVPAKRFPYEAIPILSELAKNGHRREIEEIANNKQQNSTVRLTCLLALYRAGSALKTDSLLELLDKETTLEFRLIALLALRWGGQKAVPVLLTHMDDPNIEVATAAACALTDAQPQEALPKFKKLLIRDHHEIPLLLLSTLATYKNATSRAILAEMLEQSLEGTANRQHLSRILDAFIQVCELPRPSSRGESELREQARLALSLNREQAIMRQSQLTNLTAQVESLRMQLKVAEQIESLRRAEYKRLLALQGDNVVKAEQSQKVAVLVESASAEVKDLRTQLDEAEAKLDSLQQVAK